MKGQEKGEHTISIFLDLSKAFNTLEHSTLLKKLEIYGIRGVPLNWFKDYLDNRSLRVKCTTTNSDESIYSDYKSITYGTPQGSCLGPLLFLVFCNDLYLNLMYSSCILFADDTTIYHSGKNLNLLLCSLEHDLDSVNDWFKANKLTLNLNKTVCIHFNKTINSIPVDIKIGNQMLPMVDHTKFLGIWIDRKLCWSEHVNRLILKLKRNSHLLFQSKRFLNNHAKKCLYYAQIFSHLYYGIGVWGNMISRSELWKLENVQNKCIKCISSPDKFLTVTDMIAVENLKLGWKLRNKCLPQKLLECATTDYMGKTLNKKHGYQTRNKTTPNMPLVRGSLYSKHFLCWYTLLQ